MLKILFKSNKNLLFLHIDNYKAKNNNNQSYTTLNNLTSSYNKEISSINNTNSKLQDYS